MKYQLDSLAILLPEINSPSHRTGCYVDPRDGPNALAKILW